MLAIGRINNRAHGIGAFGTACFDAARNANSALRYVAAFVANGHTLGGAGDHGIFENAVMIANRTRPICFADFELGCGFGDRLDNFDNLDGFDRCCGAGGIICKVDYVGHVLNSGCVAVKHFMNVSMKVVN